MNKTNKIKLAALVVAVVLAALSAKEFHEMRSYKEPVILGPSVTEVQKLSTYGPSLAGTVNDVNLYIMDSGKPGGTVLILGGTHPEEPVGPISTHMIIENAKVEEGRLVVVTRANRSASLYSRNGEGYPNFFHVKTSWGEKQWRLGDRSASPLDSWPDPEVYIHYPSHQMLAYMDIRNLNRAWPGRPDGLIVERTTNALMNFVRQNSVDVVIDLHEAELEYAVENTIVAHEKAQEIAAMASMMLTQEFQTPIEGVIPAQMGMEFSPKALHGLTHREVGDHSNAMSLLFEVAEPFLDRIRGVTDEHLLMEGKDEFVVEAGKHKLLYAPMDERGWGIDERVGRHLSSIMQCVDIYTMNHPDRPVKFSNIPRYAEVIEKKIGSYLQDPSKMPADKVVYD